MMRRHRSLCLVLRNVVYSLLLSSLLIIYVSKWLNKFSVLNHISPNALEFIQYKETSGKQLNSTEVRYIIDKYNKAETILNLDKFGHLKKEMIIIVVQVNKYRDTFKYLLASLSEITGIQDTLLIFSHSYVDDNVNKLIQNIEFCPVLQIFYPYSLQAYPNEFPGYSENDCPYDMGIEKAEILKCTGANTPDIHGRYRQPARAEKKLFWWWTANKVFQNLSCIERPTGLVIFLEDDLYLMQDFLYMIYYMRDVAKSLPQCEIISIGTDPSTMYDDFYRVEVSTWDPRHLSSVLALDASVWKTIVARYDLFCTVDDSSWSKSLLYLSLYRGLKEHKRFKVVYSTIPRVIKISSCSYGVLGSCDILENVLQVLTIQKKIKNNLFPPYLEVHTHIELEDEDYLVFDIAEGGWNDPRDKDLCRNITFNKVLKLVFDMEIQFQDYNNIIT